MIINAIESHYCLHYLKIYPQFTRGRGEGSGTGGAHKLFGNRDLLQELIYSLPLKNTDVETASFTACQKTLDFQTKKL